MGYDKSAGSMDFLHRKKHARFRMSNTPLMTGFAKYTQLHRDIRIIYWLVLNDSSLDCNCEGTTCRPLREATSATKLQSIRVH